MHGFDRITLGSIGAGRTRLHSRHADHNSVERLRRDDGCCQIRDGHLYLVYHQLYSYSRSQRRTNRRDDYRQLDGTGRQLRIGLDWALRDRCSEHELSGLSLYQRGTERQRHRHRSGHARHLECRYPLKAGYSSVATSNPVTVTAQTVALTVTNDE
jgi:hypothetical protein